MFAPLTVVVICCDDERVFSTIDSVDLDLPIIVSLVPNESLEERLRARGVQVVLSRRGSNSISVNRGLDAVKTKAGIIIDSDCCFHPGCLAKIISMLQEAPLARTHVHFETSDRLFASNSLAEWYSSVNNRLPIRAYTPGLALKLDIIDSIGGYYFDERIFWSCDSEFSKRVTRAGLEIAYLPDAAITHAPISLAHFIRSGYKHGMGNRAQVKLGLRPPFENPDRILGRLLYRLNPKRRINGQRLKSEKSDRILNIIWTIAFYVGYYRVFFHPVERISAY